MMQLARKQKKSLLFPLLSALILSGTLPSCLSRLDYPERPSFSIEDYKVDDTPRTEAPPERPTRPDGLFAIKPNYCLCRGGHPALALAGEHCQKTCQGTGSETDQLLTSLIGEVEITNSQLNAQHEEFKERLDLFCNLTLSIDEKNPRCYGRIQELHSNKPETNLTGSGTQIKFLEGNRFQIDFSGEIEEGKRYGFRIQASSTYTHPETGEVETLTGHTSRIEFKVQTDQGEDQLSAPLKIGTAKRYHCHTPVTSGKKVETVIKRHFIFDANNPPPPIPSPASQQIICHNKDRWGLPDNRLFPRLGEENAFHIWDQQDRRFYLEQGDGEEKSTLINKLIQEKLLKEYNIVATGNFFQPLIISSSPVIQVGNTQSSGGRRLGFFLPAITGPHTDGVAICPSAQDLHRSPHDPKHDPIFSVLSEFINDTEALYTALRTPRVFHPYASTNNSSEEEATGEETNGQTEGVAVDDILFIHESLLKNIWFYRNDNNQVEYLNPKDKNFSLLLSTNALFFYWPPDPTYPTVKKNHQEMYQIRTLQEIEQEINGSDTLTTHAPNHDRRYGCIPKSLLPVQ